MATRRHRSVVLMQYPSTAHDTGTSNQAMAATALAL